MNGVGDMDFNPDQQGIADIRLKTVTY